MEQVLADLARRPKSNEEDIERWAEEDGGALTDEELARMTLVHPAPSPDEIRTLRESLGLTQWQFANRYGFGLADIERYEAGEARPSGAATSLLRVIQLDPEIVVRALRP